MSLLNSLKIHHIGYAVKNIDKSIELFGNIGYVIHEKVIDEKRKVIIAFAESSGYLIELIAPLSEGSPVDSILRKNGSTPYHICYETEDVKLMCQELKAEKYRVISEISPAPAIGNANVVFLFNPAIGIIELVETNNVH